MSLKKTVSDHNRLYWDRIGGERERWFPVATPAEIQAARDGHCSIRVTAARPVPREWLEPLSGRRVLCLAGGGGRQAPLLAAAGAHVTVLDISEQQLQKDAEVARREGLPIDCLRGDIGDLSCFADRQFDLIVNPCSVNYVEELEPVWRECHRVLVEGGQLIAGMLSPIHFLFDARAAAEGRLVARHRIPYSHRDLPAGELESLWGPNHPIEFGHSLESLLGGQIAARFAIIGLFEDRWGSPHPISEMIPVFLASRAEKR